MASDLQPDGRSVTVDLDRANAARFGITPAIVDNALYDAYGQRIISTIFTQSNQYRVILDVDPSMARSVKSLDLIYLPSAASTTGQTPLGSVANFTVKTSPLQISHLKQFPVTTISFNLAPGASLGEGVDAIGKALQEITCRRASPSASRARRRRFSRRCRTRSSCSWRRLRPCISCSGCSTRASSTRSHPDHASVRRVARC